jgi:purine-binding chemotaxis protein CheW
LQVISAPPQPTPAGSKPGFVDLVVFRLGGNDYALLLEHVLEVVRMVSLSPLPGSPHWVRGVINLRGVAIPVIDGRGRLGLDTQEPGLSTPIVVVRASGRETGIIADEVVDVVTLPKDAIEPAPPTADPSGLVSAIGHHGDRLLLILDPDTLSRRSDLPEPGVGHP